MKNLFGEPNLNKGDKPCLTVVHLGDLLNYLKAGLIGPYEHNRGNVGISEKNIKRIIDDFEPEVLGMWHLAQVPGGRYEMVDAHTREEAIRRVLASGVITFNQIKATEIPVKIVPSGDKIKFYRLLNRNTTHTTAMKVTTPDLALGHFSNVVLKRIGENSKEWKPKMVNALCALALALNRSERESGLVDYPTFNIVRYTDLKEYVDAAAGEFEIDESTQKKFESALKSYLKFCKEIEIEIQLSHSKIDKQRLNAIIEGDGALGFFIAKMMDSLHADPLLNNSRKVIGKMVTNSTALIDSCMAIAKQSLEHASFFRFYHLLGVTKRDSQRRGRIINSFDPLAKDEKEESV